MTYSVKEKNSEKLDLNQLEQVCGGGLFSSYSDKQYAAAGVNVIGPGWFYNDGYSFNGIEIGCYEASALTYYFLNIGKRAPSLEEALRYYDECAASNHPGDCDP